MTPALALSALPLLVQLVRTAVRADPTIASRPSRVPLALAPVPARPTEPNPC